MSTTSPAAEAPWTNVQIEVDGFTLVQQGVVVRLEGALTSELLLFEAL